jgi:pyridoxine 5-phosphate synthase
MAKLGVNIDHVATIRQDRGGLEPDPVAAAAIAELAGADGITIHLREDRRHIQDRDLRLLRETVKTRLNLEMAATREMIDIALSVKPDICTLVPEKRQELTTEGGLDVRIHMQHISEAIDLLQEGDIPVSLFIDPDPDQIKAADKAGADYIEIHTGAFAEARNWKGQTGGQCRARPQLHKHQEDDRHSRHRGVQHRSLHHLQGGAGWSRQGGEGDGGPHKIRVEAG